jgi:PH (Pleckstrin Homology) domain-containing protein
MELRHSAMPEGGPPVPGPDAPEPAEPSAVSFRVDRRLTALRAGGAVLFVLAGLVVADRLAWVFAFGAAGVLVVYTLRDLLAPVRLAADTEGVTVVTGFAGRHRLAWSEIERVRVDEARRFGTRSELVEIDADERLYLFSTYDLGARCHDVVQALTRLSARSPSR